MGTAKNNRSSVEELKVIIRMAVMLSVNLVSIQFSDYMGIKIFMRNNLLEYLLSCVV